MTNVVDIVIRAADEASRVVVAAATKMARGLASITQVGVRVGAALTAAVSAGAAAAPALAKVAELAKAVGGAAPMLVAFGVAGKVMQGTLKLIFAEGSKARDALTPFADAVKRSGDAASAAAASGIKPLAQELSKAVSPDVERMMVRIGEATNRVQKEFFGWAKSAQGVHAIHNILTPIGEAAEKLAPSISRVAIAFTGMLGRIMNVSMHAGTAGLTGILDRLAEKFDKINALTVASGLDKLKNAVETVRNAFQTLSEWVSKAVEAYRAHQAGFTALSDAFAVAAIALGGPVGVLIGTISLLINHFDQVKAAWQRAVDFFTNTPAGMGILDDLQILAQTVHSVAVTAFNALADVIEHRVLPFIKNQLAPAFHNVVLPAIRAVADFVNGTVIPAFSKLADIYMTHLAPAVDRVVAAIQANRGELSALWAAAQPVVEILTRLATSVIGGMLVANLELGSRAIAFMIHTLGNLVVAAGQVAAGLLTMAADAISALRSMLDTALGVAEGIARGFAKLPGPLGAPFRGAAEEIARFRGRVNSDMAAAEGRVRGAAAGINGWLAGIRDKNVTLTVTQRYISVGRVDPATGALRGHRAAGGPPAAFGAAGGGPRGALAWVGEMGRELVRLPHGSRVVPHGQSEQIAARVARAGAARVVLELRSSGRRVDDLLLELLRHAISANGGDPVTVLRTR